MFNHFQENKILNINYEDRELTRRLVSAGEILGIDVLDHIVIGEREHVSFADRGWLSPSRKKP